MLIRSQENDTWSDWYPFDLSNIPGYPHAGYDQVEGVDTPSGYPKQSVVSGDGWTVYSREYINSSWQDWVPYLVEDMSLPVDTSIRDINVSYSPVTNTHIQRVLTADGSTIFYREYNATTKEYGPWSQLPVSQTGIQASPVSLIPLPQ